MPRPAPPNVEAAGHVPCNSVGVQAVLPRAYVYVQSKAKAYD